MFIYNIYDVLNCWLSLLLLCCVMLQFVFSVEIEVWSSLWEPQQQQQQQMFAYTNNEKGKQKAPTPPLNDDQLFTLTISQDFCLQNVCQLFSYFDIKLLLFCLKRSNAHQTTILFLIFQSRFKLSFHKYSCYVIYLVLFFSLISCVCASSSFFLLSSFCYILFLFMLFGCGIVFSF